MSLGSTFKRSPRRARAMTLGVFTAVVALSTVSACSSSSSGTAVSTSSASSSGGSVGGGATTAAGSPAAGGSSSSTTAGAAKQLDKVTMWLSTPMTSFDPAASSTNPIGQLRILTSGQLYRLNKAGQPQPELVASSTTSADNLTLTMKLKPGLKYSDGSALSADDVVASYQHDIVAKAGGDALFTPFVKSVEAPDATTVVWHLLKPYMRDCRRGCRLPEWSAHSSCSEDQR